MTEYLKIGFGGSRSGAEEQKRADAADRQRDGCLEQATAPEKAVGHRCFRPGRCGGGLCGVGLPEVGTQDCRYKGEAPIKPFHCPEKSPPSYSGLPFLRGTARSTLERAMVPQPLRALLLLRNGGMWNRGSNLWDPFCVRIRRHSASSKPVPQTGFCIICSRSRGRDPRLEPLYGASPPFLVASLGGWRLPERDSDRQASSRQARSGP